MGVIRSFRITLAYDGTAYAGWQVQPDAATVQGVLQEAAERVNGARTPVPGAGRTDAGVHARGQCARFDTGRRLDARSAPRALNAYLPEDVAVTGAEEVDGSFHPVRDATSKRYRYTFRRGEFEDPFDRRYVLLVRRPLDVEAMRRAARGLEGRRDFRYFQKSGSPRKTTVRTLRRLDVAECGDYIHLGLEADGFLYGMARNLAGTLLRVGQGSLEAEEVPSRLERGDSSVAGPCLPPHGLCLMQVVYTRSHGEPK